MSRTVGIRITYLDSAIRSSLSKYYMFMKYYDCIPIITTSLSPSDYNEYYLDYSSLLM